MNKTPRKISFFIFCILSFSLYFSLYPIDTSSKGIKGNKIATFAGGCFWCTQKDFDQVKGVISTTVGYTGGTKTNPTYEEVSAGNTGHVEAVQIVYNPQEINYKKLLEVYFHNVDPTDGEGQFCDRGKQYRPIIFFHGPEQKQLAETYKERLIRSKKILPIKVEILPASHFYPAEKYHQKYYQKKPLRYRFYRFHCGRDKRLKELWGDYSQ